MLRPGKTGYFLGDGLFYCNNVGLNWQTCHGHILRCDSKHLLCHGHSKNVYQLAAKRPRSKLHSQIAGQQVRRTALQANGQLQRQQRHIHKPFGANWPKASAFTSGTKAARSIMCRAEQRWSAEGQLFALSAVPLSCLLRLV